jgi:hypothetical protein
MNSEDKSFRENRDYYIIFGLILLVFLLSVNTDLAEFSQRQSINIPTGFFLHAGVDLLVIISWILILFSER